MDLTRLLSGQPWLLVAAAVVVLLFGDKLGPVLSKLVAVLVPPTPGPKPPAPALEDPGPVVLEDRRAALVALLQVREFFERHGAHDGCEAVDQVVAEVFATGEPHHQEGTT